MDAPSALSPEALRWVCDPTKLGFETTDEVDPARGVVGQDTAVAALRFGLETDAPGQNIFVRGLSGTGRLTLVRRLLKDIVRSCPNVKDRCYVYNFTSPEQPRLITLAAGEGKGFRRRIDRLADFIRDDLGPALASDAIKARRRAIDEATSSQLAGIMEPFEKELQEAGFAFVSTEADPAGGPAILPLVEGKPVAPEAFDQLHVSGQISDTAYQTARKRFCEMELKLRTVNDEAGEVHRNHAEQVASLMERTARSIVERTVRDIPRTYDQPVVQTFLDELIDDVVTTRLGSLGQEPDFTRLYRVNLLLEHKERGPCPIVVENTPSLRNMVGAIEFDFEPTDEIRPTHLGVRAGSLLRADGGFLIIEDRDIVSEPETWKALKRVLRNGCLEITAPDAIMPGWAPTLKPEPIEIDIKVVLLGDPTSYDALDALDPEFSALFKVLADFDTVIPRDDAGRQQYAAVIARIAKEEGLPPFDRTAVAALVEHGARIAASATKLTARFGRLADIAREAAFVVSQRGDRPVTGADIVESVRRGKQRADLPTRRFLELITDRTIRVETSGSVVGQINGLGVLQAGPMVYGFPARITASIGPGSTGMINIEGEAALSGSIHTKGFYIVGGALRTLLQTDHPLVFDASVAFEQSYGSIDGDSASGPEICCLLSALTRIALRQDLAMTGAVDQMGHILAVGAVNEKIEGFFDACRAMGLTGTQGVLIPKSNLGDLMLRDDLVKTCAEGRFKVYPVESVEQALTLLTGRPAGARGAEGNYPPDSILGIAVKRAGEYWRQVAAVPGRLTGN